MNNVMPELLKSKKDQSNMIAALDIGTSKVVVIVAELQADGILKIIGKGQHVSKGLKKGQSSEMHIGKHTDGTHSFPLKFIMMET